MRRSLKELTEIKTKLEAKEHELEETWKQTDNMVYFQELLSVQSQISYIRFEIGLVEVDNAIKRYKEEIKNLEG